VFEEVLEVLESVRSTIWRLGRQGSSRRHGRISRNAVAWVEGEVAEWMRSKIEASA
jgi:predicted DNA-binding transcriptional regulator AlpA